MSDDKRSRGPGSEAPSGAYPVVDPQPSFPAIEQKVLASWRAQNTFRSSVEQRETGAQGSNEYVFYDGPPFANGLPHYGHLVTGYIKDIIPRYQTLRGRRVERRFGWDCHGLPAELEAEKELGVHGRLQIIDFGIQEFNDHCLKSVYNYTEVWRSTVDRAARWVDFENDYKTLDLSYMESVIWAIKQLFDKGLLYEGFRVMPYSWAAQTPLSNFETRLDDAYRERQDPAISVRFALEPVAGEELPTDLLAWTTTPWTLPSNLALAVGPEIEYAVFLHGGRRVILGEATAAKFESELDGAERVGSVRGSELVGRRYEPLFPFFAGHENAFRVLSAEFVDTEEGTGVVHMAPGFGEDDMEICEANDIAMVCPVDDAGLFTSEVTDWAGEHVFDANKGIIRALKDSGRLFKHETIVHSYPHCWRTDTPLIYRAMSSWYVKVSAIRDRMVELNQQINWIPAHVKDGLFGNWLEGARDWSISRNRFWGTPIPVWKSDDPDYPRIDVYGSLDELEADFGIRPNDLHRPRIDELVRPNPDDPTGKSMMRRVPEVLDCWFDSGSMPYAQVHYPFENREWFDEHFPADFITEYLAQSRGWFYTMMVLGTALFDKPPFQNVLCHGVVLDEDGVKLSKRKRNYPDPEEVFERIGSDALRWFMVSSPLMRGGDLRIDREGKQIAESVRLVINPIWNAYSFFCLYANTDGVKAKLRADSPGLLDRYILAKTQELVEGVARELDAYEISAACAVVTRYIDALNNWYIRRSRPLFWRGGDGSDSEKQDAYDTLYTVLVTLCRVVSPLLPLISEEVYRGLTGEDSVHLSSWPEQLEGAADPELVAAMDRARDVCSATLALRSARNVRVRQPLAELVIAGPDGDALRPYLDLIADEVNVKAVTISTDISQYASSKLQVNARAIGPRLGGETKKVIAASKQGEWKSTASGGVLVAGHELEEGEYTLLLEPREGVACEPLPSRDALVVLDLELSAELVQEGLARDVVRVVQQARKQADLHVADRISLHLGLPDDWSAAVARFRDYICEQTLATELVLASESPAPAADGSHREKAKLGEHEIEIEISRSQAPA